MDVAGHPYFNVSFTMVNIGDGLALTGHGPNCGWGDGFCSPRRHAKGRDPTVPPAIGTHP